MKCIHAEQSEEPYGRICLQCEAVLECYDDERDYRHEEDDEPGFDCGWVRGVGCQLAGTEECDFECPHRDGNYRGLALMRARLAKRRAASS